MSILFNVIFFTFIVSFTISVLFSVIFLTFRVSLTMSILFSIIFRGSTVLAKFASCAGNFSEVSEQIMSKIPHNENSKMTYSHERFVVVYK